MIENFSKLFYVEPDHSNGKLLKDLAKQRGYEIICYQSGNEALENIDNDFIGGFVEVNLNPRCVNGLEFYTKLKEKGFEKPTFVLTSNWDLCNSCMKCGYSEFLKKPFGKDELDKILFDYFPRKIFCIDDDESSRMLIELLAERHLLKTDKFESVNDFCTTLESNPEMINTYMLGIVDMYMPGQFGNVLVDKLRAKGHTLPLYLHTAEVNLEEGSLIESGFSGLLKKDGLLMHSLEALLRKELVIGKR